MDFVLGIGLMFHQAKKNHSRLAEEKDESYRAGKQLPFQRLCLPTDTRPWPLVAGSSAEGFVFAGNASQRDQVLRKLTLIVWLKSMVLFRTHKKVNHLISI